MKAFTLGFMTTVAMATMPAVQAAPPASTWNGAQGPALPLRYIDPAPILRLTPQIANAETYASEALYALLYPSIARAPQSARTPETTIQPSIASKNSAFTQNTTRGNLSTSYVQEFAYIDVYSNTGKYDNIITLPTIQMSLAMPRFGNGFGGGYLPLRFGFGPIKMGTW